VRQPKELVVKQDRARYWISVGAQPSDTVVRLLKQVGVLDESGKPTAEATAETSTPAAQPA
jgi:small subunit ribosomal protein S16